MSDPSLLRELNAEVPVEENQPERIARNETPMEKDIRILKEQMLEMMDVMKILLEKEANRGESRRTNEDRDLERDLERRRQNEERNFRIGNNGRQFDPVWDTGQNLRRFRMERSRYGPAIDPNLFERNRQMPMEAESGATARLKVKMKSFKGEYGPKILIWLEKYAQFARISGWTEDNMIGALQFYLEGPAELWWTSSLRNWNNWRELCQEITATFYPPEYEEDLERELMSCEQKDGESVDEFRWRLETLCKQLDDPYRPMTAREIGRRFKNGLKYGYRQYLEAMSPGTIEQYAAIARRFEKDEEFSKRNDGIYRGTVEKKELTNKSEMEGKGPIRCHKCNEIGHIAPKCPNMEIMNMIKEKEEDNKEKNKNENQFIPATIKVGTPDGIWEALVDTGSSVSLVDLKALENTLMKKRMRDTWKKEKKKSLILANGGEILTYGTVEMPIEIAHGKDAITHTFLVVKELASRIILGLDFLAENKMKIDLVYEALIYRDTIVAMKIRKQDDKGRVNAVMDLKIVEEKPMKSEKICEDQIYKIRKRHLPF